MSGGQTFQWANHFPGFMDIAIAFCGCERTSLHNQVFLEGIKRVLPAANEISCAASKNGRLETVGKEVRSWSDDERAVGLKASARVYAGCGFSQTLDRHRIQQNDYAAKDLEDFLIILWESWELDNGGYQKCRCNPMCLTFND